MIIAPYLNYHNEYDEKKLRDMGILNDDERAVIIEDIIEAELKRQEEFLSIARNLLYPTKAKFGDEFNSDEESEFYSQMFLIGNKLAFNLNNFIPNIRQVFTLDASTAQDILEEVYSFLDIFENHSYAVRHVFSLNPYYQMITEWRNEIQETFTNEKFIARAGVLKTKPPQRDIKNENSVKSFHRIEWLGTQKELGEMFIELRKNGWIKCGELRDIADAIESCFTKSDTMKVYFRLPHPKNPYPAIYTKRYIKRFDEVKPNVEKKNNEKKE